MSKIGICLGGVENGKMMYCNDEFYYVLSGGGDITTYRQIDLKFIKEVGQQSGNGVRYTLKPTLDIYVPTEDYDKYEFALKVILNNYLNADWELVNDGKNTTIDKQ